MLSLKEFISETLLQITEAIVAFDKDERANGASVNPALPEHVAQRMSMSSVPSITGEKNAKDTLITIDFDISVTAENSTVGGGKASIAVLTAFSAQGGIEKGASTAGTNRVSFRLPLRLPNTGQRLTKEARAERLPAPNIGSIT